jgi:hypothetical protein
MLERTTVSRHLYGVKGQRGRKGLCMYVYVVSEGVKKDSINVQHTVNVLDARLCTSMLFPSQRHRR